MENFSATPIEQSGGVMSIKETHSSDDLFALFARHNMIGKSPAFRRVLELIKKISACEAAVLIEGETGTGKEVASRAIHYLGPRRNRPFIPVNCGALPDQLLENELFGHEKGAFTDAKSSQSGLVALANGGTLFLDEVDTLSPKAQVALLRFVQTQEYRPLGSRDIRHADLRIIAATNRQLLKMVQAGQFREDLFFRLNILTLTLPPLRERHTDIELLAHHLLQQYRLQYRCEEKILDAESLTRIRRYSWPGNIRELENVLHRAFLLADGTHISVSLPNLAEEDRRNGHYDRRQADFTHMSYSDAKHAALVRFETSYLDWLMRESQGNVSAAARLSGHERRALGKMIKKHQMDKERYKGNP